MKIKIIYIVVDTARLTLYKPDGETVVINQGDARIARILEEALPVIQAGGVAEVDLEPGSSTAYGQFEEQTGGLVRFFKVAKNKLSKLFGGGDSPVLEQYEGAYGNMSQAIADILVNAESPAVGPKTTEETVVAVVGNNIVPNADLVNTHITHSVELGSTKGMSAFFARIAAVMDKRSHSVEDLLRFMEKGDLPVADDGTIIAYKVLRHSNDMTSFVDCHTRRVTQRVGSMVRVLESLVDRDRKNECSNGLHIARRSYIQGFSGDVCVIVKVAPEDVVTVPHKDANKVRVCAYHIIGQITQEGHQDLRRNQPLSNAKDIALLASAISGKHIGQIEEVLITQQQGKGIQITDSKIMTKKAPAPIAAEISQAKPIVDRTSRTGAAPVAPKAVNQKLLVEKAAKTSLTPNQKLARDLYDQRKYGPLKDFKLAKKKSWAVLGFNNAEVAQIMNPTPAPAPAPKAVAKPAPAPKAPKATVTGTKKKDASASMPSLPKTMNRKEIAAFYTRTIMSSASSAALQRQAARDLLAHKQKSKVSWEALGVTAAQKTMMDRLLASAPETPKVKVSAKTQGISARMKRG